MISLYVKIVRLVLARWAYATKETCRPSSLFATKIAGKQSILCASQPHPWRRAYSNFVDQHFATIPRYQAYESSAQVMKVPFTRQLVFPKQSSCVLFLPSNHNCLDYLRTTESAAGLSTCSFDPFLHLENLHEPTEIQSRNFASPSTINFKSRTTWNLVGGNPKGSAVKKNGREGICERKLLGRS